MSKDQEKKKKLDKKAFQDILKKKEVRDYSYAILFFIVSSFFAFFVIRPVLSIAISLQREGQDLERINTVYEDNITRVLTLQQKLEIVRPKVYLLDEALPNEPRLNPLIAELREAGREASAQIDNISIEGLRLKSPETPVAQDTVNALRISVSINGDYNDVNRFIRVLANQRRIKTINSIRLKKAVGSDDDGNVRSIIRLQMDVQTYFL